MQETGKLLIIAGFLLLMIGLLVYFWGKIPFVGRLPGDIVIERENFTFYFPIVTCLVLSLLITIIIWIYQGLRP